MSLFNYKKIDLKQLQLNRDESKKVTYYLKYNNNDVLIKTPQVHCKGELIVDEDVAYLDVEMPKNKDFSNLFNVVDSYILDYASKEQSLPKHRVEENYKPTIMQRDGKTYVRVRLPLQEGLPTTKIFDVNGSPVDIEKHSLDTLLKKGDKLMLLISPEKVRISKTTVKCNWYVQQMKIHRKITDCLLSDSESSEDEDDEVYESEDEDD